VAGATDIYSKAGPDGGAKEKRYAPTKKEGSPVSPNAISATARPKIDTAIGKHGHRTEPSGRKALIEYMVE
jgi:hypothetical protein